MDMDLEDWGYREGAGPGECKIRGKFICEQPVKCGFWECEPGSFDVPNRTNTESVYILKGRVRISQLDSGLNVEQDKVQELGPGESLVLPKGCSVKWEILETVRKFFTISP